ALPRLHGPHRLRTRPLPRRGHGAHLGAPRRARGIRAQHPVGLQPVDGATDPAARPLPEGARRVTPEQRATAALGEVETRLHAFVDAGAARATRHSAHYAELWRTMRTAVSGGKRVRPRLLLSCFTQLTSADEEPAIQLAVAIELLHTEIGRASCRERVETQGAGSTTGNTTR